MERALTADEHFERGLELHEAGQAAAAHEHFRTAYGLDPAPPRHRSYYGLGLALVEGRFSKALELCRSAAKDEFYNPRLYLNLARAHLCFGFKAEGVRYLRRGLMIDPGDAALRAEYDRLGVRRPPVLRFLPRRHPVNRLLGRLRRSSPQATPPGGDAGSAPGAQLTSV